MKDATNDTYMGLSGVVWCIFAGIGYGSMNVFVKLACGEGIIVSRFIIMMFAVKALASFIFGKFIRKTDFDIRKYPGKSIGMVFIRSVLVLCSKSCQYAAITYIPLSMSSYISFTTGPIFAGLLAFILIQEKLSLQEVVAILSGIIGTSMLTMPQWYLFLGLGTAEI